MRSWLRRNRWGLVALPVAVVFALAGSSELVKSQWWDAGFHEGHRVEGATASFSEPFEDGDAHYPRAFEVTVLEAGPVADSEIPSSYPGDWSRAVGTRVWSVDLSFTAEVTMDLTSCRVGLVGDDGALYAVTQNWDPPSQWRNSEECVPDETPGPKWQSASQEMEAPEPGEERPRTWPKQISGVLPEDVEPVAIRFWFYGPPRYVEIGLDSVISG